MTLFILLGMTSVLVTSTHFFSQNQHDIRVLTNFEQTRNNKVMETYLAADWTKLADEVVVTSTGEIAVDYDYQGISTAYRTHQLGIRFTQGTRTEVHQLERSVAR